MQALTRRTRPWTLNQPPAAMIHLPRPVLDKAVEIANAMLAQGHDEGQCIRVGIVTAKRWAARRGYIVPGLDNPDEP